MKNVIVIKISYVRGGGGKGGGGVTLSTFKQYIKRKKQPNKLKKKDKYKLYKLKKQTNMVDFLGDKLAEREHPRYAFQDVRTLKQERGAEKLYKRNTIAGSSTFQALEFTPDATTFSTSNMNLWTLLK